MGGGDSFPSRRRLELLKQEVIQIPLHDHNRPVQASQPQYQPNLLTTISLDATAKSKNSIQNYTGNPLFPGWYADPEAQIFEDKYWIYPSVSDSYEKQTYFDCFSSPDLIHWTKHERILDFADIPWSTYRAAWAPTVARKNGKYYMYFSAGDGAPGAGIGVAVADQPEGPFKDILGKALVDRTVLGAEGIDPAIFIDCDHYGHDTDAEIRGAGRKNHKTKNYLFWGGWGHCVVVELEDNMVTFRSPIVEITPPHYVEAPWMLKRKGVYYLMYSVGAWTDNSYGVEYVTSTVSPMGPFTRTPTRILFPNDQIGKGVGSHSVLHIRHKTYDAGNTGDKRKKDVYYMVYHRRPVDDAHPNHRYVCIDQMEFDEDGNILPITITKEGVLGQFLEDN